MLRNQQSSRLVLGARKALTACTLSSSGRNRWHRQCGPGKGAMARPGCTCPCLPECHALGGAAALFFTLQHSRSTKTTSTTTQSRRVAQVERHLEELNTQLEKTI
ncbi:hypothetical protein T10_4182 [Trichinella papuae]|uniref:Uncharacterized protein n=1 Tax=Trichinella papuae TaxID=268474 RepID=A0A0V1MF38_9BILA|nr:hypothetical protein T10_4182 [Trichinella papuae]